MLKSGTTDDHDICHGEIEQSHHNVGRAGLVTEFADGGSKNSLSDYFCIKISLYNVSVMSRAAIICFL